MNISREHIELRQKWLNRYLQDITLQYPELIAAMTEKPFTVAETEVHPKIVADWNAKGLLLSARQERKHHRLSTSEFLWIKMIEKMRELTLPFSLIEKVKDNLVKPVEIDPMDVINGPIVQNMLKGLGAEQRAKFESILSDPKTRNDFIAELPMDSNGLNQLDMVVLIALVTKRPVSLLIYTSGDAIILSPLFFDTEQGAQLLNDIINNSCVNINVTHILAQVLTLAPLEKVSEKLKLITENEALILTALKEGNLKSVKIRFDNKSEMEILEITKNEKVDKSVRLMELMLQNGYQDISVKNVNGNIVHCENTRKLKLK